MYRFMQIQHSSDTCKMLGELHGGATLSECLLAYQTVYVFYVLILSFLIISIDGLFFGLISSFDLHL